MSASVDLWGSMLALILRQSTLCRCIPLGRWCIGINKTRRLHSFPQVKSWYKLGLHRSLRTRSGRVSRASLIVPPPLRHQCLTIEVHHHNVTDCRTKKASRSCPVVRAVLVSHTGCTAYTATETSAANHIAMGRHCLTETRDYSWIFQA